ncbi:unnamed protein product [Caenorhabditis brenneri]
MKKTAHSLPRLFSLTRRISLPPLPLSYALSPSRRLRLRRLHTLSRKLIRDSSLRFIRYFFNFLDFVSKMEDEKATAAFNQMMLNTLLVEFLRDVNLPFDIVNNSKFRAFCRFISPLIKLPIPQELVSLNCNNIALFIKWDKVSDSSILNSERDKYVKQWAKYGTRQRNVPTEIASTAGMSSHDMKLWCRPKATIPEVPVKPLVERKSPAQVVHRHGHLANFPLRNPVSPAQSVVHTDISSGMVAQGHQPLTKKNPVVLEETKPSLIEYVKVEELAGPSTAPDGGQVPDLFPCPPIPAYTEKKGNGIAAKLITFPDVPGYIKWPCLVCSQRREVSKLRSVNTNDGYIMLYICVKGGQYDMKKAKELARMEKFKCCVDHLQDLYEQGLHSLSITDPRLDIHTENQKVVEAYHMVKEIKEARCTQKLIFEGSRKHVLPFINQLKKFFFTYGRSNYTAQPGQPGYLVEPN